VSNTLIVESLNDQYFIEALLTHWGFKNLKIDPPICGIDNFQCLEGLSQKQLTQTLADWKRDAPGETFGNKIGIIIDLDQESVENRLKLVNSAISKVFETELVISQMNHWIIVPVDDAGVSVEISCYFMNVDGKGELETVLKAIKCKTSTHADCLEQWRQCVEIENKLTEKVFDKFWIQVYERYDCCDKKERYQAGEKCSFKASLEKGAYDLDSPILADLITFLKTASSQTSLNYNE